jgi:hypothetical protein
MLLNPSPDFLVKAAKSRYLKVTDSCEKAWR